EAQLRYKTYEGRVVNLSDASRSARRIPEEQRSAAQKEIVANTARLLVVSAKEVTSAMTKHDRSRQEKLLEEIKKFDRQKPSLPTAMALQEIGKAPKTFVLRRGELKNPGDEVQAGRRTIPC